MNRRFSAALALAVLGVALAAGRPAFASPSIKIGYVDFQKALNEVEEGKSAKERLKREFEDKQRKLEFRKNELSKMLEEVSAKKELMTEAEINKRQQDYQNKLVELKQTADTYQQELAKKEADLAQSIIERLKQVVEKIGKEGKYEVILQNVVVYSADAKDLTEDVIKAFNKSHKGSKSKD